MSRYILRRLLHTGVVALAALALIFILIRLSGDPADMMAGPDATPEQVEEIRRQLGLDQPLYVQFGDFLIRAVQGDFGNSLRYGGPVLPIVLERLPATLELTLVSLLISAAVGIPAGIISATRRGSLADRVVMVFALWGQTIPSFWLGIVLILVFAVQLGVLPTGGREGVEHIILPATALASFSTARVARLVRSEMLEVISQDYIRVARSKGLTEGVIVWRHALKNAAIPVITIIGLQVGHLMGGAVITETIFSWPGVGRLLVQSIQFRDYPVIQVAVLLLALTVTMINLFVDLSYAWLDPRIRYG